MKRLISEGGEVLAIVPDQFSFDYDKALYACLGARDFNAVTVLSFKRLSETLIERHGSSGALLTPAERTVIIYLALRKVRAEKSLRLLGRSLEKPAFAADTAAMLDSLRRAGIAPDRLLSASEKIGGTLGDKLFDVSEIYSEYLSILAERALRDESSVISEGAKLAAEKGYFKNKYVFIEHFDSFSPDELLLIRAAISDSKAVTVSITMPSEPIRSAVSPFLYCQNTVNSLVKLCAETNTGIRYFSCNVLKTGNALLNGVGDCLYTPIKNRIPADRTLRIYRADSIFEEADLVASEIRRLVSEDGYKLSDIAVLTHDIDGYSQALGSSFERYGIEAFTDRSQPASGMAMSLFMMDAVAAASTRKPDTEKILRYLRSPFSPLEPEEISALWDYCVRWNVEGEMWLSPFTAGDFKAAEAARIKAVTPILKLKERTSSSTAQETAKAFCEFLNETDAAGRAFSVIEDCADPDMKLETARLFKQLWNAVMTAVSSVYMTAGDVKLTLKSFGEILGLILSGASLSNPPQKLECVTVADVTRSVIRSPKVAFVIGLADGLFPAELKKTGLFSGRDLKRLEEEGLSFEAPPEQRLSGERYDCYKALSAPTERLILSWSGRDLKGKDLRPSRFIRRIRDYCGAEVIPAKNIDVATLCSTPAAAYYALAVSDSLSSPEREAVRRSLDGTDYGERLKRIKGCSEASHRLSPPISRKLFASKDINVTASRIDVYNRCGYEYFCKYGLKIEPVKPIEIDPANRGTVMHFLFERVLMHFGSGFSEADEKDICEKVNELLAGYFEENLGGDFGKSAKYKADYSRLGDAAAEILLNMKEEFKVSKFRPERFEYDLSHENGESALSLTLSHGIRLNVRGVVDRVDTYTDESGQRYLRVIDYKTGEKKFSLSDVYNGINLQLLLYILALTEGRDADFRSCKPAGILYMRAGFLECDKDADPLSSEQKSRLERSAEQLRRSGLIVSDEKIISAMDSTVSGRFVPVKLTQKGIPDARSQVISEKGFKLLESFAKNKTIRFGEDLLNGRIDAVPAGKDPEHLQCAYCDYWSVCDRKKYLFKIISKQDGEMLKSMISEDE